MKTFLRRTPAVALFVVAGAFAAEAPAAGPCFTAGGNTITVMNLPAKKGAPLPIDVEHMTGASAMVSEGSVANSIQINNVKRDAAKNVASFDATIDDKAYQYPRDRCKK